MYGREDNKPYDVGRTQTKPQRVYIYIEYPERKGKEWDVNLKR